MKPFLKWAGSKYRVLPQIRAVLPAGSKLIEPFCGSAAVALNVDYSTYMMNDFNPDLVRLYQILCAEGTHFIERCRTLFQPETNHRDAYYAFRDEYNETQDAAHKAALFLYLNRHAYNGLYRTNRRGKHNVPFGRYVHPYFPEQEMLAFYNRFRGTPFLNVDFEVVMRMAKPGDVIYGDPPYVPLTKTANFTAYQAGGFTLENQVRLARVAQDMANQGVTVVISNHDTPYTRDLYRQATLTAFTVQRMISRDASNRRRAAELLAVYSAVSLPARQATATVLSRYATT